MVYGKKILSFERPLELHEGKKEVVAAANIHNADSCRAADSFRAKLAIKPVHIRAVLKMNILIVSYVYPHREDMRLGLFVQEQAKEFVKQGHKVYVLTSGTSNDAEEYYEDIKIIRLGTPKFLRGFFFNLKALKKIISIKDRIDIIHLHFIGMNLLFLWIASKIKKVPLVATTHGIDVYPKNPFHNLLLKIYLFFPKKIMAVSRFTYDVAARNTSKRKMIVINNGVDLEKLGPKESPLKFRKTHGLGNKKILLSVGGLVERKGHRIIIESLSDVVKKVPNVLYLIVGRGSEERKLKDRVSSLNLQDNVRFLGYVNDEEISNYFDACNVFILMSKTIEKEAGVEGFGIAYIEASAVGKPVIGGKSGGTGDAIIDGVTGFRIEPEDKSELTKKLILLLSNAKLRKKMGEAGRKMVLSKFLWKHNVKETVKVYEEAIKAQNK